MPDPKTDQVDVDITNVKDLGNGQVDVWLDYARICEDDGTIENLACHVRFVFRTACAHLVVEAMYGYGPSSRLTRN